MDVYHKVLARVYEITGGKDTVDVDLVDLLKREGFFPSLQNILEHLSGESWVTETSQKNIIRITHWGVAEAKRVMADLPDRKQLVARDASKLLAESRELVIMLEEFEGEPSSDKLEVIKNRIYDLDVLIRRLTENLR